ncbi:MAG: D-glycerate dehydrogenase [Candidatus Handelsmanbacteria bacterium]|nr:D-glycerate dehydrogenase [Candidatus Handelsmanbacteria bacterium]
MRRLKVLFLPVMRQYHPWGEDVVELVGRNHDLTIYDPQQPLEGQFAQVDAVIDHGGAQGTRAMMDAAKQARLWQVTTTGFEHVDVAYLKQRGIPVAHSPGFFSCAALAETAMMFILMLSRRYRQAAELFGQGQLYEPMGEELGGKVLGIVGFGASGQELARRARGFGMKVQAIDLHLPEPAVLEELKPEFMGSPADLDQVVAQADFLSLHLHSNPQTHHTIDGRRLGLMKPTACLINVARGALADEEALYEALIEGRIGGAGLDVFAREPIDPGAPVFQLPNVVATPHTAGVTRQVSRRRAQGAAENVDRVAKGFEPLHRIDT